MPYGGVADQRARSHDGTPAGVGGDLGDLQLAAGGYVGEHRADKGRGIEGAGGRLGWDGVVVRDGAAVDAASDDVMESIGGIQARAPWHAWYYTSCQPHYN